jgi:glyoxylase-like metal-dependent hydrolase (beta-lactamase superfamily II)
VKVHHLNCGTMRPPGRRLINGDGGLFEAGTMVCHCLLVETDAGLVLIDSGIGLADTEHPPGSLPRRFVRAVRPALRAEETAIRQVTALGYDPADVRHVVLTHLDLDHAGGLRDFPHATVHVLADELAAASAPRTTKERERYRTAQWSHGPKWATYTADGEPWFGFAAARELTGLPAEILLIPLAGHTRGHAGVAVQDGSGWLLHAGDAYFHRDQLAGKKAPLGLHAFQSFVDTDRPARKANQQRLVELANDNDGAVRVFSAHDPVELAVEVPN